MEVDSSWDGSRSRGWHRKRQSALPLSQEHRTFPPERIEFTRFTPNVMFDIRVFLSDVSLSLLEWVCDSLPRSLTSQGIETLSPCLTVKVVLGLRNRGWLFEGASTLRGGWFSCCPGESDVEVVAARVVSEGDNADEDESRLLVEECPSPLSLLLISFPRCKWDGDADPEEKEGAIEGDASLTYRPALTECTFQSSLSFMHVFEERRQKCSQSW